jgi:membrane dipeptidase
MSAPSRIQYQDFRNDRGSWDAWASNLGISREAIEIYATGDVIDLHVDTFIWNRIFGYNLGQRHGHGALGARFYSQVDFPRIREAGVTGATWVITTNPARLGAESRAHVFVDNIARLRALFASAPNDFEVVRTATEYRSARAAGKHGAFIGIQGGNALDRDLDALDLIPDGAVLRVTLVHLSNSALGTTSAPNFASRDEGLTAFGRDYVKRLNEKKIFVDLAHISRRGFWDAVRIQDKSQPLLVTHTGVSSVFSSWRNLDDDQIRAVATSGGTVGVMFHGDFLGPDKWHWNCDAIVSHLEHIVKTVGEDHASLGSDWDGAIITPRDMPTCLELPTLVQRMLDRQWKPERIQKVLGGNFLRVLEALRG